ncbi:carbohydrate-binding module family 13 protein [Pleurotus ostreatus PC15]|uniref:Carbohydrate-binding module family 13 protein n=2 Tax=Pleurotus TaxID=5320 RepID=A0A067NFN5_PLEO1|nr:hypothetical protein CCMSSC00406_0006262 [Pleurotus cornucopiae]KDQ22917.1 carbohydrate-binding module family 13 protein [Pleurotus ostreatus PC15]
MQEPQPRTLKPGVYLLNNQKGGTAADLSGGDRRSLIGFPVHSGINQQWRFNPSGAGFFIQSVSNPDLYVSVEGLHQNVPVVAIPFPVSWVVEPDESDAHVWRILWPESKLCLDLEGHGSSTPGAKVLLISSYSTRARVINSGTVQVVLTERKFFETSQLWTLSPVDVYNMPRTSRQRSEEETDADSSPLGEPTKKRNDDIVTAKPPTSDGARGPHTLKEYLAEYSWTALPVALVALVVSLTS